MQQLAPGQENAEVPVNENFETLSHQAVYGKNHEDTSGLTFAYYGGIWGSFTVAGASQLLGASTTTYMVVLRSSGAVSFSTSNTNWNNSTSYARAYRLVTDASSITAAEDHRGGPGGAHGQISGGTVAATAVSITDAGGYYTGTDVETALQEAGLSLAGKASTAYVDAAIAGLSWKQAVRAATTVAGTLASSFENGDTIDGVTLATGDRILIKNQAAGAENGIYVVAASGAPARASDANSGAELVNASVYVSEGTTLADTQWTCTTNAPITPGSTSLAFAQLTSGGGGGTVTSVDASGGVQTASGSAITGTGTIRGANVVNAQTGTSYAVVAGDRGKRVTFSNASAIAATIAQAGTSGFEDGYYAFLENIGVGAVTLTPTTSTVNGAATLVLQSGYSAILWSDGTNYRAFVIGRAGPTVNAQTGTSYTYLTGDRGKLVTHSNASAIAGTLPQATGAFGSAWFVWVQNTGAGTLTITPTTSTIDGAATLALTTNQGALIVSDGTNYFTFRGAASGGGGLTNWTEAVNTSSPNATVPVSSFTATNAATNVDAALIAKGTGALLAQVPNSLASGGNKRGTYATDFQKGRTLAAQVASGNYSFIGSGEGNTASGADSAAVSGTSNVADGARAFAGAGTGNQATGADCFVGGGDNNAITSGGVNGAILGGRQNQVTAQEAAVLGGRSNAASGLYAIVSGFTASVTAEGGQAHGRNLVVDGQYSHGRGRRFNAQGMFGVDGWASGSFSDGSGTLSQGYDCVLRARTTDATSTRLTTDGAAASTTNSPALSNSLGASCITVTGVVTASGTANNTTDAVGWEIQAVIRRGTSGNCALIGSATVTAIGTGSTAGTWTVTVTADTTNQTLSVAVAGEAAKTINWSAFLRVAHASA